MAYFPGHPYYGGYGHAASDPVLAATEEVYKQRNDTLRNEYDKFIGDQRDKEIKTIGKMQQKLDKYTHKSKLLEDQIRDEVNKQQDNTNTLVSHQSMANENALLRSSLKKAGIDRIHRQNQNVYDTAMNALTERYSQNHLFPYSRPFYPQYVEPPPVIEETEVVVKSPVRHHKHKY